MSSLALEKFVNPEVVRSPEEQAAWKGKGRAGFEEATYAADLAGEPCACGTSQFEMCLAHWKLHGQRRHVRPGHVADVQNTGRREGRTSRRPRS